MPILVQKKNEQDQAQTFQDTYSESCSGIKLSFLFQSFQKLF